MLKKGIAIILSIITLTMISYAGSTVEVDKNYFDINIPDILDTDAFDNGQGFDLNITLPNFENGYYDFSDEVGIRDLELKKIEIVDLPDEGYFSVPSNSDINLGAIKLKLIYNSINYGQLHEIEYETTLDKLKLSIPKDLRDFYYFDHNNLRFGFTKNSQPGIRVPIKLQKDNIFVILPIVQVHPLWSKTVDLSANIPSYDLTYNETLNIEDIQLFAYYDDGTKDELNIIDNPNTLNTYIQYYDRKKINNSNDYNIKKITFKDTTKLGDKITIYFEYKFRNNIIKEKVIVNLVKNNTIDIHSEHNGDHYVLDDIQSNWAYPYIESLNLQGKLVNVTGNSFYPNHPITRAEAAAYISNYLEFETSGIAPFTDIYADAWYYEAIGKIYRSGVINGYPDGTFRPDDLISRQELAVILVKAYKLKEKIIHEENNTVPFEDDSDISSWAKQYVYSAKSLGLIEGRPGNIFDPFQNMSRSEIVTIIDRMLK